jgi:hypothetical protein
MLWGWKGQVKPAFPGLSSVQGCRIYFPAPANAPPRLRPDELQFVPDSGWKAHAAFQFLPEDCIRFTRTDARRVQHLAMTVMKEASYGNCSEVC